MHQESDVNNPLAAGACMDSHTHIYTGFTAVSPSPVWPFQENYGLIAHSHGHHRGIRALTQTNSWAASHANASSLSSEKSVPQSRNTWCWKVKQEGRLGINVFSESCFPITKELCLSDVYRIACVSLSCSSHISSAWKVKKSPHTGRDFVMYVNRCIILIIHPSSSNPLESNRYAESNGLSTNWCKGQVLIL